MSVRRTPTVYGDGAIESVPRIVAEHDARRVLLVCGRTSFEASGAAAMLGPLRRVAAVVRWSDFAPNTDVRDLEAGLAVLDECQPDLVLGIGGGSTMDMAKLLCAFEGLSSADLRRAIDDGEPIVARRRKLVLAPTTSGSGSQATHFAVVYIGEAKFSVAGPGLYPDNIVLDPLLPLSGTPHQRATSGIDAVCQAVESLWAVGASTASRRRSRFALSYLLPAIEPFVTAADAHRHARSMCIGSHLAGQAIDVAKTTAAHALSYAITKRYGVDHGNAVALVLGPLVELHARVGPSQLRPEADPSSLLAAIDVLEQHFGVGDGEGVRRELSRLLGRLGLVNALRDAGVSTAGELDELASAVNTQRLGNNPVPLSETDLRDLLAAAM